MMTYKKLLELIQKMSEAQLDMQVTVMTDEGYMDVSTILHVDADMREDGYSEDQPILA